MISRHGVRVRTGALARFSTRLLGADAFVFGRSIFLSRSAASAFVAGAPESRALLAHELAHVEQFRRLGMARFLARYLAEYLRARGRGATHAQAYGEISFEREARESAVDVS
ncbi:MAG TPA: DUF4157 domain-containing protein [Thermoanaerobaculia bacterium]